MTMQNRFERELDKLKSTMDNMCNLVENQIRSAFQVLLEGKSDLIPQINENEKLVDSIDTKVDKLCMTIFALTQPVASDLRFILASLKINNEIERIGDIAISIINNVDGIIEEPKIIKKLKIEEISLKAEEILKKAIESYRKKDITLANDILANKDVVKNMSQQLLNNIIKEMTNKSEIIVVATNLIIILRQIERISDHSTNIAESVVFIVEGQNIKHSKNKI